MDGTGDAEPASVAWRRRSPAAVQPPIVETVPSLELKLEHPALEASGRREQFFPDAVPYGADGEQRTFYWRPALVAGAPEPSAWRLSCATTHGLAGIAECPVTPPPLLARETIDGTAAEGAEAAEAEPVVRAVVGGTVAGDATTVGLVAYDVPAVRIEAVSTDFADLAVDDRSVRVPAGSRRTVDLAPRRVTLADGGDARTIQPELSVRFPGERTLYHPAPGADHRLFPSFGLDIDAVASPISVPTTVGELDHEALAAALDVDLAARPYPERVLWQAFAHAAFDPHEEGTAAIGQLDSGLLVVEPAERSQAARTASSSSS